MKKRKLNKFEKQQMTRLALAYEEASMWTYILEVDDKHKKPNQVDKMRHRAVQKQAFKRAKKFVLWMSDFQHQNHEMLSDERMDD